MQVDRRLWGLGAIALVLEWLESLLTILSGPLLTAGLLIALVDLLTDGALLTSQPWLLYGWAVAMGCGLDAQLIGASVKMGRAARARRYGALTGYAVLVALLAYVAFVAAQVFATQQADGLSTAQALARLGMDSTSWLIQRSALSVALVVLSGLLRYHAPSATTATAGASLDAIQAQQQIGIAQIGKYRAYWQALHGQGSAPTPPTDGGTPVAAPAGEAAHVEGREDTPPRRAAIALVPAVRNDTRKARRRQLSAHDARAFAFGLLDAEPGMSRAQLRAKLGVRQERANGLYTAWELARGRQARAR